GGNNQSGESPKLTNANLMKLKIGCRLKDVEAAIGSGTECTDDDVQAVMGDPQGRREYDMWLEMKLIRGGRTLKWYHWKNGASHLFVGLDPKDIVILSGTVLPHEGANMKSASSNGQALGNEYADNPR